MQTKIRNFYILLLKSERGGYKDDVLCFTTSLSDAKVIIFYPSQTEIF